MRFAHTRKVSLAALAAAAALFAPGTANAALIFQAEQSAYTASADGATQPAVKVYLVQTAGTTTVSANGDLNSVGVKVTASSPPANPVQLLSITSNPAYTGAVTKNLATGFLYEELPTTTGGVAAESTNRYYLGTFTFSGQSASTTTFTVSTQGGASSNTFTGNGTALDPQIQSSQFTVNVPEPAAAASAAGLAAAGLLARRRRVRAAV